jgi:hypothetical protein
MRKLNNSSSKVYVQLDVSLIAKAAAFPRLLVETILMRL